jgi:hypothetical protein
LSKRKEVTDEIEVIEDRKIPLYPPFIKGDKRGIYCSSTPTPACRQAGNVGMPFSEQAPLEIYDYKMIIQKFSNSIV